MKTFVFRLARKDGTTVLGELLNIEIKAERYADAAMIVMDKYPEHNIIGHTAL